MKNLFLGLLGIKLLANKRKLSVNTLIKNSGICQKTLVGISDVVDVEKPMKHLKNVDFNKLLAIKGVGKKSIEELMFFMDLYGVEYKNME